VVFPDLAEKRKCFFQTGAFAGEKPEAFLPLGSPADQNFFRNHRQQNRFPKPAAVERAKKAKKRPTTCFQVIGHISAVFKL
jgi:hypothetical protein